MPQRKKGTFVQVRPANIRTSLRIRALIRTFTGRILDSQRRRVSSCGQRILLSACAGAQAHLSLRWAHTSVRRYVYSRCGSVILTWIYIRFEYEGLALFNNRGLFWVVPYLCYICCNTKITHLLYEYAFTKPLSC